MAVFWVFGLECRFRRRFGLDEWFRGLKLGTMGGIEWLCVGWFGLERRFRRRFGSDE
jgi:hypothetical protein